ncbi:MAG: DEAD/DEAH box helicase family protein [Thermoanaerobacteraceae bacterium]|nr:DEAD/DEAH box helicase family protein [Thermoanaerobacteraceae bacterium]
MTIPYPIAAISVQTTGLDPETDKIVEVGAAKLLHGEIVDRFHSYVYYENTLDETVKRITGLSAAALLAAPKWHEVKPKFEKFCSGCLLAGHNVSFHLQFLGENHCHLDGQAMDTLELAKVFYPQLGSYSLENLNKHVLTDKVLAPGALNSAVVTARLLKAVINRIAALDAATLRKILHIAPETWRERLLFELINDQIMFQEQDGFFEDTRKQPSSPPISQEMAFSFDSISRLLSAEEGIGTVLPQYELRPQQVDMAKQVFLAFDNSQHLVVEAGTGTGKTLAYLTPAALWALNHGQRVVVSTNTISLQQQLWEKDIPLLERLLPEKFQAALLKGRSNYLCLRKWSQLLTTVEKLPDWQRIFCITILIWQSGTLTGDKAELNIKRRFQNLWGKICADGDTCWGSECSWFRTCYVTRAKQKAAGAHIIVANHALVLADCFSGHKVLPEFSRLIVDEAQHFEATAAKQTGVSVTTGQLMSLADDVMKQKAPVQFAAVFPQRPLRQLNQAGRDLKGDVEKIMDLSRQLLSTATDKTLRITEKITEMPGWKQWWEQAEIISSRLVAIQELVDKLLVTVEEQEIASEIWDKQLQVLFNKVSGFLEAWQQILLWSNPDYVTWLDAREESIAFNRQPINVGPILNQAFYPNFETIVFTSATISINNNFKFFEQCLGLQEISPSYHQVTSPFDYQKQSLICIPADIPPANDRYFLQKAIPLLEQLIGMLRGASLVLFTSHQMLQECYYRLKDIFSKQGIKLLGHNIDGDRWQLVEQLKKDTRTVIFGAQSFWEGVDVPGDSLQCVIIMRLPFIPPAEPPVAARMELLENNDKNSFYHLSLPEAILRFKQGVGRLIRSRYDKGVIVVLDTRITSKSYGKYFLQSLPGYKFQKTDSRELLSVVNNFLKN